MSISDNEIHIVKLTLGIGAEVRNFQLSVPMDQARFGVIHEALSAPMKEMLGGQTALRSGEMAYRGRYAYRGVNDTGVEYPNNDHPVVRTHPVSKRKSLCVNRIFTARITVAGDKPY